MRAQRKRGGARGIGSDSELESGSVGEEDGPDGRGPLGSETGRGGALCRLGPGSGGMGRRGGKGGAPVGPKQKKTACEKGEKKKKRKGGPG